jgi:hypothetical protein
VYFAGEHASAPDVLRQRGRRRRLPSAFFGQPVSERRSHVRRDGFELIRERRAASVFGEKSQQDEPQVAVDRSRARGVLERTRTDLVLEFPAAVRRRIQQPCSSRSAAVTSRRSAPAHSGKHDDTGSPSVTAPSATSCIKTDPVAIGLVSEARSKGVSSVAGGAPASNDSVPSASCQIGPALLPTSTVAAGKTRARIASARTRRAASEPTAIDVVNLEP